jgi:hypothetical protein
VQGNQSHTKRKWLTNTAIYEKEAAYIHEQVRDIVPTAEMVTG